MNDLLQQISVLWQDIVSHPGASLAIIGNLIIIESLLSVDNAAVLATMVMDLPQAQRNKALKYGIWGAYFFRGLAMIFAAVLIKIWWLKPLGGLYLLYLVYDWYKGKQTETKEDDFIDKKSNWLYKATVGSLGSFWATVCLVELMDMAFSIDNVFAAVAFTPNIILVCIGVFIGILAMRFIAQWFVKLMEKYNFLETAAFIVIGILGLKLLLSLYEHFYPESSISKFLGSHAADIGVSVITVAIFFIPIITSIFFNVPKKHVDNDPE
jgi:YkoY family integral membrane protein